VSFSKRSRDSLEPQGGGEETRRRRNGRNNVHQRTSLCSGSDIFDSFMTSPPFNV